jgi:hypothetical protein
VTEKEKPDTNNAKARGRDGRVPGSDAWLARIFLLAVIAAGLVSLFSGAAPETLAFWPCPFHAITKMECPGCGMTRACIALARGDIGHALNYNPLSPGLILFAAGFAIAPQHMRRRWQSLSRNRRSVFAWSMLGLVLGFWAYRIML